VLEKPSVTVEEAIEKAHKALTPKPSSPAPKLFDVMQHAYVSILGEWNRYLQAKLEAEGRWDPEIGVTRSVWSEVGGPADGFMTTTDVENVLLDKKLRYKKAVVTKEGAPLVWVWMNPSAHDRVLMAREEKKKTVLPQLDRETAYDAKGWADLVKQSGGDPEMSGPKSVSVTAALAPDPTEPPADLDQFQFRLVNVYPMELVRCMHVADRSKNGVAGKLYEQLGHDVQLDTLILTGQAEEGWQSSISIKLSHQEYARESAWSGGPDGNKNTSKVYVVEDDEVYVFELDHPGNFEAEKERWCRKFYELVREQLKVLVPGKREGWLERGGMYERVPEPCPTCKRPHDKMFVPPITYWVGKDDTVILDYGYGGGGTRSWLPLAKREELRKVLCLVRDSEPSMPEGDEPLKWKYRGDVFRPYVHVQLGPQQWGWYPSERLEELIHLLGEGFDEAAARERGAKLVSDESHREKERTHKASKRLRDDAKRMAETVTDEPDEDAPPGSPPQKDLFGKK